MKFESLDANARDLYVAAMSWMEERWDQAAGLLWDVGESKLAAPHHVVRGIEMILRFQFDAPGRVFHGTFLRAPEEPYPPADAVIWRDYDPNWREFIGIAFALILLEFTDRLPGSLVQKIDEAMRKAVVGALSRGLSASYTNIALMYAFMLCFSGKRFAEPIWFEEGERMARQVYRIFKQHNAFTEYNSPTYYGVDLYALALWRSYPAISPLLAQLGSEMETSLWRDIAQFYHADLRNLCGPFDRSYGMDMRRYVALVGIHIRLATDKTRAPLPDTGLPFEHAGDIAFAPLIIFLGVRVPADVLEHFTVFRGEHQVERIISDTPRRIITVWLGKDWMIGGEFTSRTAAQSDQFYPATIHWRIDTDQVGWARVSYLDPIDVRASENRLEITTTGEIAFLVHAPGTHIEQIKYDTWHLKALTVRVDTNATEISVHPRGDCFEVRYTVAGSQPIECILKCEKENS